jgi:hypothetical protein
MIEIVYTPTWFYGKDLIIDIISVCVLLLIAIFSAHYYRINRLKKNYFYLALSFSLLAIAFICKIAMNFSIEYNIVETRNLGFVTLAYETIKSSDTLFYMGFLLYRLLTLLGLYILYTIYQRQTKTTIFLMLYMIIIATYFSQAYYHIFHFTALILLLLITHQHIKHYRENNLSTTRMLAISFGIIALSQVIFVVNRINSFFYVTGEIVQLMGYIMLLLTFITVLRYGKKKNKN